MELMEMVQPRETVVLVCYALRMGNAEVGFEHSYCYIQILNGYLNQTQSLFARTNSIVLECVIDSDCTGDTDTCVSNVCVCGSTEKCPGDSTCVIGKCKCGEHEECSETEFCIAGECLGM